MPDKQIPIPPKRKGRPKLTSDQKKRKAAEKALGYKLTDQEWKDLQKKRDTKPDEAQQMQDMMAKVAHAQASYQPNVLQPEDTNPKQSEPGEDDPDYEVHKIEQIQRSLELARGQMMDTLKTKPQTVKDEGDHEIITIARANELTIGEDETIRRKPKFVEDDEQGFVGIP